MNFIKTLASKPIPVFAAVVFIFFLGGIGLSRLPVQLTPDVEFPQITVLTYWPGATPYEIETEIIEKQEEKLKDISGLKMMESSSYNNYGEVTLTFDIGIEIPTALLYVSNKMNEVEEYPENAEEPEIETTGATSDPILWLMLKKKGTATKGVNKFQTFFDNEIKHKLERIKGVSSLYVEGGTKEELHINLDLEKMARHKISIAQVKDKIVAANRNRSVGILGMGKKDYRLRVVSRFQDSFDPMNVVVFEDGIKRIYLKDIASSSIGYEKEKVSVMQNSSDAVVVGVHKEQGANVLDLLERIKNVVTELNENALGEKGLYLDWGYDQSPYIKTALSIVKKNLFIGGLLAIIVLYIFLRSISATITTAIAIPVSVFGTFFTLWIFGRNLNVVSLAGISFAVGMLVDNSIVVLENIDRHRKMGKPSLKAAYHGAGEVFGAVVASTLTTIAVFFPVIFIKGEAGQLFRDIAIAITASILFSLFVSVAVIPAIINYITSLRKREFITNDKLLKKGIIDKIGGFLFKVLMSCSRLSLKNRFSQLMTILFFTLASFAIAALLLPKAEYLPQGNQNYILNLLIPPPGASVEKRKEIGDYIYKETKDYFEEDHKDGVPKLRYLWYMATDKLNLFGAISHHDTEGRKMMPLFNKIMRSIPDMLGVCIQVGIFQHRIGCSRAVDVNISGDNMEKIIELGHQTYVNIMKEIPGARIRPVPSLESTYPEVKIIPDKKKLASNGLTEEEFGHYLDIMMDGSKIDDYVPEGKKAIDLVLKGRNISFSSPEELVNAQIVNKFGQLIRIKDIADIRYSTGLIQIDHLERNRTVKLEVSPPNGVSLQEAADKIRSKIVAPVLKDDNFKKINIQVTGSANRLMETKNALQWNFIAAIIITYLLMAALFENLVYPLIVLFTIPLAGAGGFIGLKLINIFVAKQTFDILTMLGFIILIGTVVNNAILIVHRALINVRYSGMTGKDAIIESVETRIRPIFMSAATSVFGLLPLVLSTGSGSELYRGVGSVLLGGLTLSTLLTIFVIPALLSFAIGFEKPLSKEGI